MSNVKIRARVRVTVEIDVSDAWGGDCALSQVHRQAKQSAIDRLTLTRGPGDTGLIRAFDVRFLDDMKVTAILVEEQ